MAAATNPDDLFKSLIAKGTLKQQVYQNTLSTFQLFKENIKELVNDYHSKTNGDKNAIPFEYKEKGQFQIELKFAGDVLLFVMHTNVFEFPRNHEVMKTSYVKENKERSYCGMIRIYNFLADSLKYDRINDIGYMIGRIFINKDKHYYIEGKREIGLIFNNFSGSGINKKRAMRIVESAILYTLNFDLLIPPYDSEQAVTVLEMKAALSNMRIKTGKRLGFKFQADKEDSEAPTIAGSV